MPVPGGAAAGSAGTTGATMTWLFLSFGSIARRVGPPFRADSE